MSELVPTVALLISGALNIYLAHTLAKVAMAGRVRSAPKAEQAKAKAEAKPMPPIPLGL